MHEPLTIINRVPLTTYLLREMYVSSAWWFEWRLLLVLVVWVGKKKEKANQTNITHTAHPIPQLIHDVQT